jgi:metal-dependent amidase/aminoacylase/carboxypeptidase family protein
MSAELEVAADSIESKVVARRRDFHAHPELSSREVRTAGIVAKHLRALGLEVSTGIAHTGVAGFCGNRETGIRMTTPDSVLRSC